MPGFLDFSAGDVLTAANMDTLAQQVVISVANSSAYPTTVHEGMTVYDQSENRYYVHSGSAWVRTQLSMNAAGRTGCFLRRTNPQSIPHITETAISWDTENTDSDGFIAVTSSTVTIPSGLGGLYSISSRVVWASNPAALGSYVQLDAGSETFRTSVTPSSANIHTQVSAPGVTMALAAGDTIVVSVYQASGGALNVTNAKLWVYRLSV